MEKSKKRTTFQLQTTTFILANPNHQRIIRCPKPMRPRITRLPNFRGGFMQFPWTSAPSLHASAKVLKVMASPGLFCTGKGPIRASCMSCNVDVRWCGSFYPVSFENMELHNIAYCKCFVPPFSPADLQTSALPWSGCRMWRSPFDQMLNMRAKGNPTTKSQK